MIASTKDVKSLLVAGEDTFGIQFHPEVYHSQTENNC